MEVSEAHGRQVMAGLPRAGFVFSGCARWWWIVPSDSQIGIEWPPITRYWPGASVALPSGGEADEGPAARGAPSLHLVNRPGDAVPYTHPLMLYFAICRLAGMPPTWQPDGCA